MYIHIIPSHAELYHFRRCGNFGFVSYTSDFGDRSGNFGFLETSGNLSTDIHPVSVTRFPSFRTQTLESLSRYLWTKGFLSNPDPGENLESGNLVMETGCTPKPPTNMIPNVAWSILILLVLSILLRLLLLLLLVDFGGCDASTVLISTGGILMSIGDFPESLSRAMLVGTMSVGGLCVYHFRRCVVHRVLCISHFSQASRARGCVYIYIYIYICIHNYIARLPSLPGISSKLTSYL